MSKNALQPSTVKAKPKKIRIDEILVEAGIAESIKKAQALILAGKVLVGERRIEKASEKFIAGLLPIRLKGPEHPYVSRGGLKLAGALQAFGISAAGKTCLDVGASTGGFTDCLLQQGARRVYAFDSGSQQLHSKIRQEARVVARENFNVRLMQAKDLAEPVDLVVVDVSFISLRLILPALLRSLPAPWEALLLIKPQFEAARDQVKPGGLIQDAALQEQIVHGIEEFSRDLGLVPEGIAKSVICGAESGNQEFFLYAKMPRPR